MENERPSLGRQASTGLAQPQRGSSSTLFTPFPQPAIEEPSQAAETVGNNKNNKKEEPEPSHSNGEDDRVRIIVQGFVGADGQRMTLFHMGLEDTILNVKIKIRERHGIPLERQALVFHGKRLDDGSTLRACGIKNDATIDGVFRHFISQPETTSAPFDSVEIGNHNDGNVEQSSGEGDRIRIVAKMVSGKTIILDSMGLDDTMLSVKTKIQERGGYPLERQALVFQGKLLDDRHTLRQCEIQNGATIHVVHRSSPPKTTATTATPDNAIEIRQEDTQQEEVTVLQDDEMTISEQDYDLDSERGDGHWDLIDLCQLASRPDPDAPDKEEARKTADATWDKLRNWISSHEHSDEAKIRSAMEQEDDSHRTALHHACGKSPPKDVIDLFFIYSPESVKQRDTFAWLPIHYACVFKADEQVIRRLVEVNPESTVEVDRRGRTPLHFSAANEFTLSAGLIKLLCSGGAASFPDENGMLPIHYFSAYETSVEAFHAVVEAHITGISSEDKRGRTPLHFIAANAGRENSSSKIRHLLSLDDRLVNHASSNGAPHPLRTLAECGATLNRVALEEERSHIIQCAIAFFTGASQTELGDGFKESLKFFPDWLQIGTVESCILNTELTRERRSDFLSLLSRKFSPTSFQKGMLNNLNSYTTVAWLNDQSCKDVAVFFLMFELYMICTWIGLFVHSTVEYLTSGGDGYRASLIWVFPISVVLLIIEFHQLWTFFRQRALWSYFADQWNWLDVISIGLVMAAASKMLANEPDATDINTIRPLLNITGAAQFLKLLSCLKKLFLPFSTFVGGTLQILWTLIPFGIISFIILLAFAFMFFVNRFDSGNENYSTLLNSVLSVFSSFVGDPDDTEDWLDFFFALVIVVVLLNVVIAIVNQEWQTATDKATLVFWTYRLNFLLDVSQMGRRKDGKKGTGAASWHEWFDTVTEYAMGEEEFLDDGCCDYFLMYLYFFAGWAIFPILGLATFGLGWPNRIRRMIFTAESLDSQTAWLAQRAADRDRMEALQNVVAQIKENMNQTYHNSKSEAEETIAKLEKKLEVTSMAAREEIQSLENKIDQLIGKLLSGAQP